MKVLVATRKTQGLRKNDFFRAREGEFVKLGPECDEASTADSCGCTRSMIGFDTCGATTTMKVVKSELSLQEYVELFKESEERDFPVKCLNEKALWQAAELLLEIASVLPAEAIVERRGGIIQTRSEKPVIKVAPPCQMPYKKVHDRSKPNVLTLRMFVTPDAAMEVVATL